MNEQRPRVLLIDSCDMQRNWIKQQLQSDFSILSGTSRQEVYTLLHRETVDLVLVGDQLSDCSGIDLLKQIRREAHFALIPVMMVSTFENEELILEVLEAGASDFIRKPLSSFELRARVALTFRKQETTERVEELIAELRLRSERDSLTDAFNRFGFQRHAAIEIAKAKRSGSSLSLIMMDVDHFKAINDKYGHLVGDEILLGFTQLLTDLLRKYDLLGRYGGDEFVLLLPHSRERQALYVAEKILEAIRNTALETKKGAISLSLSLGVASYNPQKETNLDCDFETLDQLLARADHALYEAKERGRNQIVSKLSETEGVV